MRQVINKLIREEDLYAAVESAFSQGWRRVKLYFLIGLPTESDEDTLGIVHLAAQCVDIGRRYHRGASVTASVGGFVPKVQTPFQWFGQNTIEELTRKIHLLPDAARPVRGLTIRWHDPKATAVEGLVSRGDRRVGAVIEQVWRQGGTFQEWSEHFDLDLWTEALAACGMSLEETVYRHRTEDEPLPWDHLSAGLHRDFLWQDWLDALAEHGLPDCRWTPCYDCGACTGFGVEHVVASATPPAGGSQGTGQDLTTGGQVPVRFRETAPSGAVLGRPAGPGRRVCRPAGRRGEKVRCGSVSASPSSARSASPASGMWPACGSGPFAGTASRWPTPPGSRPVPSSASGWPCPRGASRWPSTSTSPSTSSDPRPTPPPVDAWPARLTPLLPDGIEVTASAIPDGNAGSLQELVTSCRWTIGVTGVSRSELEERVAAAARRANLVPIVRERKGRASLRRPATLDHRPRGRGRRRGRRRAWRGQRTWTRTRQPHGRPGGRARHPAPRRPPWRAPRHAGRPSWADRGPSLGGQ